MNINAQPLKLALNALISAHCNNTKSSTLVKEPVVYFLVKESTNTLSLTDTTQKVLITLPLPEYNQTSFTLKLSAKPLLKLLNSDTLNLEYYDNKLRLNGVSFKSFEIVDRTPLERLCNDLNVTPYRQYTLDSEAARLFVERFKGALDSKFINVEFLNNGDVNIGNEHGNIRLWMGQSKVKFSCGIKTHPSMGLLLQYAEMILFRTGYWGFNCPDFEVRFESEPIETFDWSRYDLLKTRFETQFLNKPTFFDILKNEANESTIHGRINCEINGLELTINGVTHYFSLDKHPIDKYFTVNFRWNVGNLRSALKMVQGDLFKFNIFYGKSMTTKLTGQIKNNFGFLLLDNRNQLTES